MVLDVIDAKTIVRAILDSVFDAAVRHCAFQCDGAVADRNRDIADIQAAVAQPLTHIFAYSFVRPYVAFRGDALRFMYGILVRTVSGIRSAIPPTLRMSRHVVVTHIVAITQLLALPARVFTIKTAITALAWIGAAATQFLELPGLSRSGILTTLFVRCAPAIRPAAHRFGGPFAIPPTIRRLFAAPSAALAGLMLAAIAVRIIALFVPLVRPTTNIVGVVMPWGPI
ncbi:hypothetical protein GCM10027565_29910 [Bordetella tumulicola]